MSDDLIRRSDAIKATWQEPTYTDPLNVLTEVRDRIEAIPSADRPQGEWAKRTHNTLIVLVNFAYCSECGQPIMHEHTRPLWSYCPNCGAKMDGERKESE